MPGSPEPLLLPPPIKGLVEGTSFSQFPERSASQAQNVIPFDAFEERARVGQRPGSTKYIADRVSGANPIQRMAKVVKSLSAQNIVTTDLVDSSTQVVSATTLPSPWLQAIDTTTGKFTVAGDVVFINDAGITRMDFKSSIAGRTFLLIYAEGATNHSVTATINALPQADGTGVRANGPALSPVKTGCFIRGKNDLTEFLYAYLQYDGTANKVRLQIKKWVNFTETPLLASPTVHTLSGGATRSDLTITFSEKSNSQVEVVLSWPSEGISETLTLTTTDFTTVAHIRSGLFREDGSNFSSYISSFSGETLSPENGSVAIRVDSSTVNTLGTDRYFIPENLTGYKNDPLGSISQTDGAAQSVTPMTGISWDTSLNLLAASSAPTASNTMIALANTLNPAIRFAPSAHVKAPASGTNIANLFFTRISDTADSYVVVRLPSSVYDPVTEQINIPQIEWFVVSQNVQIATGVVFTTGSSSGVLSVRKDDLLALIDPGSDGDSVFRLTANGFPVFEWTISSASINSTAASGLYTGGIAFRRSGVGIPALAANVGGACWLDVNLKPDGGEGAVSLANIETSLILVSNGSIRRFTSGSLVAPGGSNDVLTTNPFDVQLQPAFNKVFAVDGGNSVVYDLTTDAVSTLVATAGTAPEKGTLLALYRGRLVISGVVTDPHNWFMSAAGDPLDFDFAPATTSATQAVAGNNSEVGLVGDIITALIPVSDDALIFGGDHTIWQLTGDPADGGAIDLVSDQTGIAFGSAWAKDPEGAIYFQGVDGVYRFLIGQFPVKISQGLVDKRMRQINLATKRIDMAWNYELQGLVIIIKDADTGVAVDSFFWDRRTESWWPLVFPLASQPSSILMFDGSDADDKAFLLGGIDGFVRKFDLTSDTDDGTAITSFVRYAPVQSGGNFISMYVTGIDAILAEGSNPVSLRIFGETTPERSAIATAPRTARTLTVGRSGAIRQRVKANAISVELRGTSGRWAIEDIWLITAPAGRSRRHKRA